MGYFNSIDLINFRNFENYSINFSKNCNVFYGKNGSGKTNILEGISLLSKGRGFRKDKFTNIIKKNCSKFIITSDFKSEEIIYNLIAETENTNNRIKKILTVNNDKSSESIELIYNKSPFLYFLPETERLFQASPSIRRNLIDQFIYTSQNKYNKVVNRYTKLIQERSKILINNNDESWLSQLEKSITVDALQIYSLRESQLNVLMNNLNIYLKDFDLPFKIVSKLIDKFYNSNGKNEDYEDILKNNRKIDALVGGCAIGPHKSDYMFCVNDNTLVSQLSTGQQKTIILLMYLSQCKYLSQVKFKQPILLLDEVCSHLDDLNRNVLLTLIETFKLQIFMTGTSENLFSFLSTNANFCNITV
ncbi:DNA replication and repair protein RecF [Alphaproteobacteria bacterium]|nr:DNA replication and repair protein RecF [Alphaproteobacteria bacterium]